MTPGTSCLATISLSLRDKSPVTHRAPRIKLALVGRAPARSGFARPRNPPRERDKERSQKQQKEASTHTAPDARIPTGAGEVASVLSLLRCIPTIQL